MHRVRIQGILKGVIPLPEEASHHLATVLRAKVGEVIELFDDRSKTEAKATIKRIEDGRVYVESETPVPAKVVARRMLVWIQGLAKGEKNDAVVQDATELGATHIVFASCKRTILKLDPVRAGSRLERWRKIAEGASSQSKRGDVPEISGPIPFEAALRAHRTQARFCLYEHAREPLAIDLGPALERLDSIAFVVGPEGGLATEEVEKAGREGFLSRSLGPRILRTETACASVLGAVLIWSATSR